MRDWQCCLLREGSSDNALAGLLERLLTSMTADATSVSARPDLRGSVSEKVSQLRQEGAGVYDLVFIHRDSDRDGHQARVSEVRSLPGDDLVPVVPVRMTEAWALAHLCDEPEVRKWLARDQGIGPGRLEALSDPKTVLRRLLSRHEKNGRLLGIQEFSVRRGQVIRSIDIGGGVTRLSAWQALVSELEDAILRVRPEYAKLLRS